MPKVRVPFQLGYYQTSNKSLADQECLNMYPSISSNPGAESQVTLQEVEGIIASGDTTISTTISSSDFFKNAVRSGNFVYVIYGTTLFQIDPTGAVVNRGNPLSSFSLVPMTTNGRLVAILTSGTTVQFYDTETNVLGAVVPIPNGFIATDVTYNNEVFVYVGSESSAALDNGVVFHGLTKSDASKGAAFNSLDFTQTEFTSRVKSISTQDNLIYAMSETETIIYSFVGTTPFAFRKSGTIAIGSFGGYAKRSVSVNNGLYFVGGGKDSPTGVYQISGSNFKKVSTEPIDRAIEAIRAKQTFGTFFSGYIWTYTINKNTFVGVSLISDFDKQEGDCFVVNTTLSQRMGFDVWHRAHLKNTDSNTIPPFIRSVFQVAGNMVVVGYSNNGTSILSDYAFVDLENITGDELGVVLDKDVSFNYINTEFNRTRFKSLQLYGDNLLPTVQMSHAKIDGAGSMDESTARESGSTNENFIEWRRLGQASLPRRFRLKMDQGTQNTGRMQFTDAYVGVPDGG